MVVIFNSTYTALTFAQRRLDAYGALIPFQPLPHIFVTVAYNTIISDTRLVFLVAKAQTQFNLKPPERRRGVIQTSNSSMKALEGDAGLLAVLWQKMSESGCLQLHPFQ